MFGGRKINSINMRLSMVGWAGQLSTNKTIFRPSFVKCQSISQTQPQIVCHLRIAILVNQIKMHNFIISN